VERVKIDLTGSFPISISLSVSVCI